MTRQSVYAKVTAGILARLQQGTAPWHKPWNAELGQPRNFVSGRAYSGINALALGLSGDSPLWLTFNQVNKMGLKIRKGSHGTPIIFASTKQADEEEEGKIVTRNRVLLRHYFVFNATDVEGIKLDAPAKHEWDPITAADAIVAGIQPRPVIQHGGNRAYYAQHQDRIQLPEPSSFSRAEDYASVRFHELTHWTGHASRLNRATLQDAVAFGDTNYSLEELVAEMGAGYLCALSGIENQTIDQNASYLASWLRVLKAEPSLLVKAASQAQRAVDYLAPRVEQEAPLPA